MYPAEYSIAEQLRERGIYDKIMANELGAAQFIDIVERSTRG
jgi:hypothetical protein